MEFSSDVAIRVATELSGSLFHEVTLPPERPPAPPYYGGAAYLPVAGPLINAFKEYIPPGKAVGLQWLTSDTAAYRVNLFLVNPGTDVANITVSARSANGGVTGTKSYRLAPHSMTVVGKLFDDAAFKDVRDTNRAANQGAASATIVGDRPFYGFAGVITQYPLCDGLNRLAISQPVDLP